MLDTLKPATGRFPEHPILASIVSYGLCSHERARAVMNESPKLKEDFRCSWTSHPEWDNSSKLHYVPPSPPVQNCVSNIHFFYTVRQALWSLWVRNTFGSRSSWLCFYLTLWKEVVRGKGLIRINTSKNKLLNKMLPDQEASKRLSLHSFIYSYSMKIYLYCSACRRQPLNEW